MDLATKHDHHYMFTQDSTGEGERGGLCCTSTTTTTTTAMTTGFCCTTATAAATTTKIKMLSSSTSVLNKNEQQQTFDPIVANMLARNFNELSLEERNNILEDIHCCKVQTINEEPEFIMKRIESLKKELSSISNSNHNNTINQGGSTTKSTLSSLSLRLSLSSSSRQSSSSSSAAAAATATSASSSASSSAAASVPLSYAYDLALQMNSSYINNANNEFYLKFLRADEYNVQKAKKRILNHFKSKLELFGKDMLVKDISFDDLSPDDQNLVYSGSNQFIKGSKDSKGRTIFFLFPELNSPYCTFESFVRARWYQIMVEIDNGISNQLNGLIGLCMNNTRSVMKKQHIKGIQLLGEAVPFRFAALHYCIIRKNMPSVMRSLVNSLGKQSQIRLKFHLEESEIPSLYTLQSYGIIPTTVPIANDGRPQTKLFLDELEKRKMFERQQQQKKQKEQEEEKEYKKNDDDIVDDSFTSSNNKRNDNSILMAPTTTNTDSSTTSTTATTTDTPTPKKSHEISCSNDNRKIQQKQQQDSSSSASCTSTTNTKNTATSKKDSSRRSSGSSSSNGSGSSSGKSISIIPTSLDVLLGRGIFPNSCKGNAILEQLIDREVIAHSLAKTRFEKTCIVLTIIKKVESSGGRFLKRRTTSPTPCSSRATAAATATATATATNKSSKNQEWFIVDETAAHNAVSARFRRKIRLLKKS